jgi:DNA-binding Lrp family transcriptional regulator
MPQNSKLDRIDFEILRALQNNARLSNKELAALVDLAPSTCLERVRRLQASGTLRGFHAAVDSRALGVELHALISVRIRRHSRSLIERFRAHVLALNEVMTLYHIAGANDFLMHVVVRDAEHLQHLVLDAFTTRSEVEHMETVLVFGHEEKHVLPNYADVEVGHRS